jgi:hypothetical protein
MAPDRRASPADEAAQSPAITKRTRPPRGPYRLDAREYPGSGAHPGTAARRPRQPAPVRLPPAAAAPATAVITGVLAWDEEQGDGGLLLLARGQATDGSRSIESLHKAVADARVIGMILVCEGFRRSKLSGAGRRDRRRPRSLQWPSRLSVPPRRPVLGCT